MSVANIVQFTASANATNVSVSIVPQLAPFVTATPTTFSRITSGQTYEITILCSIPIGILTPSIFRGTLHLVSKSNTLANPFEIVLLVDVAAAREVRTNDIISDSPGVYYSNNQIILTLKSGFGLTDATSIANSIGGQVVGIVPSINSYQLELPSTTIDALNTAIAYVTQVYDSVVEFATKHMILGIPAVDNDLLHLQALNPSFTAAYDKVGVQPAWTFLDSLGPLLLTVPSVAEIDTGIDPTHPEFAGVDLGSIPRDLLQDFAECGHGTQVAGIIGANNLSATSSYIPPQMNGIIAGVPHIGAGYTMEIRPSVQPAPFGIWASIDSAIRSHGAQIMMLEVQLAKCSALSPQQIQSGELNCSSSSSDFEADKRRWFRVISSYPAVLWILPAGNYGIAVQIVARETDASDELPAGISPPSNNTMTVGATDLSDARAIWDAVESSDFGAGITIAAPGSDVYAPVPLSSPSDPKCQQFSFTSNAYIRSFKGTSASGPFVAGASATLKAIEGATPSKTLTPLQIKNILVSSADPISTDKPIGPRLNILRAVQQALAPPPTGTFMKALGTTGDDFASSIQTTSDGGFIVAGYTSGLGAGGQDVLLVKLDGAGAIQWAKTAGTAGNDVAFSVRQTSDGGYIVSGSTDGVTGVGQFLVSKFDGAGTFLWANSLGTRVTPPPEFPRNRQRTADTSLPGFLPAASVASGCSSTTVPDNSSGCGAPWAMISTVTPSSRPRTAGTLLPGASWAEWPNMISLCSNSTGQAISNGPSWPAAAATSQATLSSKPRTADTS